MRSLSNIDELFFPREQAAIIERIRSMAGSIGSRRGGSNTGAIPLRIDIANYRPRRSIAPFIASCIKDRDSRSGTFGLTLAFSRTPRIVADVSRRRRRRRDITSRRPGQPFLPAENKTVLRPPSGRMDKPIIPGMILAFG